MTGYTPTPEQAAVVSHPLEPLRVAAGAGTGKTATVVDRLVALIRSGIPPEAALGITFTNRAAEELADRLRAALPDFTREGREVEVTTYHAFAHGLLQEFGALVGVERDARIIGPGYVRQLLLDSLREGDYAHLDLSATSQRVAEAATLAAQLGDNLRSAADLVRGEAAGPDGPHAQRRELASIVHRYEGIKRALGVVDYADLIRYAHRLVSNHPLVAQRVRRRYRCVVLDEYQDTAPAQRELLRLLFADGFPVTAVGDSDQTLYEWRGASHENFDAFPDHFPKRDGTAAATLPLSVNHRSWSRILDVAHAVRGELHDRSGFLRLRPRPGVGDGTTEARWFRTAVDEAVWIASELRRLHDEEGVGWGNMAVLFRKNRQIALLRDACRLADIPIEVAAVGGLLDVPEVADLLAWLRLLHQQDDTISLARILFGSRYRLGMGDLVPLVDWTHEQGLGQDGDDEAPSWPLLEAIDRLDEIQGLTNETRRRLAEFGELYRSLLTRAQGLSLVELCRRILDALDAWAEVEAMAPASAVSARLNLYRFLDLAQGWSPLHGRRSLEAFLSYLDLLREDPATEELDTARVGNTEAVALLTVHRAKGLEWDSVFLPALADGIFPARPRGYDNPADQARYLPFSLRLDTGSFPDLELSQPEGAEALRRRHAEGEWRTAYVAVTRARRRLYLSGAHWYGNKRPREPSRLFEVAAGVPSVRNMLDTPDAGERPERLSLSTGPAGPDPLFPDGWRTALRRTLEDPRWPLPLVRDSGPYDDEVNQLRLIVDELRPGRTEEGRPAAPDLSVTGLVTLAGCPRRYHWSEVDRLPRRPAPALRRGIRLHRRIELHNRGALSFADLHDDLYDAPTGTDSGEAPVRNGFEVFLESRFAERTPRFIETPIDLKIGSARVHGRIDAVYEGAAGSWEIVDYKSGRLRGDQTAIVQLEAYALAACEGAVSADTPEDLTVTFLYLGGTEPEEVRRRVDDAWLQEASNHLRALVAEAQGTAFPPRPSPACLRCDFLRFCDAGRASLDAP